MPSTGTFNTKCEWILHYKNNFCIDPKVGVLKVWVVTQTWVAEGQKMGRDIVIQICQNSIFKFFQFHHGIIIASYAFHLAS